jgi:hypothetical protein
MSLMALAMGPLVMWIYSKLEEMKLANGGANI